MTLEEGNKDIIYRRTQLLLFEEDVTEINVPSRSKSVSQTHTICNLRVGLSVYLSVCLLNVPNYPQSAVTFCGCLIMAVLCVN